MINEVIEPRSGAACIIDFLGFRAEVAKVEELGAGWTGQDFVDISEP